MKIGNTVVKFTPDPDNPQKRVIKIQVCSTKRKGLKADSQVSPEDASSAKHLTSLIAFSAAVGAEYLADKYGDNLDPETEAKNALEAFGEECKFMREMSMKIPAKLKVLLQNKHLLSDEDNLTVSRYQNLISKGIDLAPYEIQKINAALKAVRERG